VEYTLSQVATAVFAITGVLSAARQRLDILSVMVVGLLTALGGGTLRDTMLDAQVFWLRDLTYFWVALAASCLAFGGARLMTQLPKGLLAYLDGVGIALFSIQAIDKTIFLGYPATVGVVMGVVTSVAGGVIRDVVTSRPTMLLSRELYATAIVVGGILYVGVLFTVADPYGRLLAMGLIFGLRAMAIRWQLFLPLRLTLKLEQTDGDG